jgi:hypothetical protein
MFKLDLSPAGKTAAAIEQYRAGNPEYLIGYLRSSEPLTPTVRVFVAEILEGKIKKKRGPRRGSTLAALAGPLMKQWQIKERYVFHMMIADHLEPSDAHRAAVAAVANELDVTESAVDKTIYPRMRLASRKIRKK